MKRDTDMSLTDGDRAIVREIAFVAAKEIATELTSTFSKQVDLHSATCERAKTVEDKAEVNTKEIAKWKNRAGGFAFAFSLIGAFLAVVLTWAGRAIWEYMKK